MGCGKSTAVSTEENSQEPEPRQLLTKCDSNGDASKDGSFSDIQVEMIKSTWPLIAQDLPVKGASVFLNIFAAEPAITKFFSFSNLQDGSSKKNTLLEAHGIKFMQVLNMVCESLPNLEVDSTASQKLMVLGAQHATIDGFDVMYLSIFAKGLHLTWEKVLGVEYTDKVKQAWSILFEYIMERIRDGYIVFNSEHEKE